MTTPIAQLDQALQRKTLPDVRPGDTVRVFVKIIEGDRARLQPFEGVVIRRRRSGLGSTVTVRRMSFGEGVERIFSLYAPTIDRIEVVRRGEKIRRARLYYLRKSGRRSRELAS